VIVVGLPVSLLSGRETFVRATHLEKSGIGPGTRCQL
jgi:hypothetical protein